MQKSIVTKGSLQPVLYSLNELSSNLAAHANATLSRAHGFNILSIPNGTFDVYGNDISKYLDNTSQVLGDYYLVFSYADKVYYAPASTTTLDGQTSNTGLGSFQGPASSESLTNKASYITELAEEEQAKLQSINDALVAHSLESYSTVHGSLVVQRRDVKDSSGVVIGTHAALITYDGIVYEIPCCDVLGGVGPAIQVLPFSPPFKRITLRGGQSSKHNYSIQPNVTAGKKPLTYAWEWLQNGHWVNIPPDKEYDTLFTNPAAYEPLKVIWNSVDGFMTFISGAAGKDRYDHVMFRLTVSGPTGKTNKDVFGKELTFDFQVQDKAPSFF